MKNKLIIILFIFILFFIQSNTTFATLNKDTINIESMPSLNMRISGPNIIRSGDTSYIKVRIFNNNSDESIILNSIEVLNEENNIIISEKPHFNFYGIKEKDKKRFQEIQDEITQIANKDITKVDPALINEINNLGKQIKDQIFIRYYNLNVSQFDLDSNGKINFLFSFKFTKSGDKKEIVTQNFTVRKVEPLPSVFTRNSPGWYAGDNHVHSEHSCFGWPFDPHCEETIEENSNAAKQVGLDWIIITDHDPMISTCSVLFGDWDDIKDDCNAEETSSFRCIRGEEIGYWSHLLAYDSPDLTTQVTSCDMLGGNHDCWQDEIDDVTSQGGIVFIAHPYADTFDWTDWTVTDYSGIEIINGILSSDDLMTIYGDSGGDTDSWEEFLQDETNPNNGFIVGIGDSDTHHANFTNSNGFTYCYMDSLSDSNIVSALEEGHCVATTGPLITFTLNDAIIGDVADICSGSNILYVNASSTQEFGQLEAVYVYVDGVFRTGRYLSGYSDSENIPITLNSNNKYVRIRLDTVSNHYSYTNPIWINLSTTDLDSDDYCNAVDCNDNNDNINPGASEICEGSIDEDCDGIVDEGCGCSNGQEQQCGTTDVGECEYGTKTCSNGQWGSCVGNIEPELEYCDGKDNDCDGSIDEGDVCEGGNLSECEEPGYEQCMEFEAGDSDVSVAMNFYQNVNDIRWGVVNDSDDPYVIGEYLIGWKGVDAEHMYYNCNARDECHDGGCSCTEVNNEDTYVTRSAPDTATSEEVAGWDHGVYNWTALSFNQFNPHYDGGDGSNPIYVLNCYDEGDCSSGYYCDKTGSWSNWDCALTCGNETCSPGENCPADGSGSEICNGIDDDCNNQTDENLQNVCGTSNIGECQYGIQTCSNGNWTDCTSIEPTPEICDNLDNDCDGNIDENCDDDNDNYCDDDMVISSNITFCALSGMDCNDTDPSINPESLENCNDGIDNDCDGAIDLLDSDCTVSPTITDVNITDESGTLINDTHPAYNENVTFNVIIDAISEYFTSLFTNSESSEELTFTGNQNVTRYLSLPKNATVVNISLELEGLPI